MAEILDLLVCLYVSGDQCFVSKHLWILTGRSGAQTVRAPSPFAWVALRLALRRKLAVDCALAGLGAFLILGQIDASRFLLLVLLL